jgi:hypothetical protein
MDFISDPAGDPEMDIVAKMPYVWLFHSWMTAPGEKSVGWRIAGTRSTKEESGTCYTERFNEIDFFPQIKVLLPAWLVGDDQRDLLLTPMLVSRHCYFP